VSGGRIVSGNGVIGEIARSSGAVAVTSGTWFNVGGLDVGAAGSGSLLLDGGAVRSSASRVGVSGGSQGSATVASGSWNSGDVQV
jgi:T5SS/PEP-CTERM-associated repeat protein